MRTKLKLLTLGTILLGIGALSNQAAAPATPQGTIAARYFLNIGAGGTVADLTNHVKFPDSPDMIQYEPYFETWAGGDIATPPASDVRNEYGAQLVGYFYPETTGDHVFFLAADDNAALYLSTDDNPANKKLIAMETIWSNPREYDISGGASVLESKRSDQFAASEWPTPNQITLQAGTPYYIEAVAKEGAGGDNLSVSLDAFTPIPGARLSPFGVSTSASILSQPQDTAVYAGGTANFSVGLDLPPGTTITSVEWQKNGVAIPDSDTTELALTPVEADNGATIRAVVTTSSGALTSEEATLTVATIAEEFTPGIVRFDVFADLGGGTAVIDLTGSDKYIANTPDDVRLLASIDSPNGYADNYGARISGYLIPPESGDYRFFVRADDAAELWLSPNTNAANAVLIAEEAVTCCEAFKEPDDTLAPNFETSAPQTLQAGTRYAFYVLFKEGGGGDWVQVAARREGDTTPANALTPLSGTWLAANAKPSLGTPEITTQPQGVPQLLQGRNATLSLEATVAPAAYNFPMLIQWQKDGVDIEGATAASYAISNATEAASGVYHAVLTAPSGNSVTTADATVNVVPDTAAPKVVSVAATGLQALLVSFDEPLDEATAETVANYQLSDGLTVTAATLGGSGSTVLLTTSTLTSDENYTLTVGGIEDPYGNTVAAGTEVTFVSKVISYGDIILADGPVAFYRFEETSGSVAINSGSTGGDGAYMIGDESEPGAGGAPGEAKGDPGPRPPEFLGFASDNRAASLGGPNTQEWIDTKNMFLDHRSSFTIEYWVKPTNRLGTEVAWSRVGIVGQNDAIEYGFINGNTVQIWTAGGGSLDTAYPFPDNEWHHVATIARGTNIQNYFDGVLVGTGGTTTADYGTSVYNVHIGGGGVFDATGNYFEGQFDEVAIFDKAIPAERIAIHYQAGREGYVPPDNGGGEAEFTQVTFTNGQLTLAWEGTATLEEATEITGPWTASASQTSPQTVTPTGANKFYRLRE